MQLLGPLEVGILSLSRFLDDFAPSNSWLWLNIDIHAQKELLNLLLVFFSEFPQTIVAYLVFWLVYFELWRLPCLCPLGLMESFSFDLL